MSRRHRAEKREITPDPKFKNEVVTKFMNSVMSHGKKSVAEQIVYGCGSEFPSLLAVFPTEGQAIAAAEELLRRTIWHFQLAGFQAARQRNPSGLISNDKMSLFIDGAWHVYDLYSLGVAGVATRITGINEVPLPNPVPDTGIPD